MRWHDLRVGPLRPEALWAGVALTVMLISLVAAHLVTVGIGRDGIPFVAAFLGVALAMRDEVDISLENRPCRAVRLGVLAITGGILVALVYSAFPGYRLLAGMIAVLSLVIGQIGQGLFRHGHVPVGGYAFGALLLAGSYFPLWLDAGWGWMAGSLALMVLSGWVMGSVPRGSRVRRLERVVSALDGWGR